MDTFSPSLKDSVRNRLREYLLIGAVQFNHRIAREILVSLDKNNAQVGKSSKFFEKAVDAAVTTGGLLAGAGPAARGLSIYLQNNLTIKFSSHTYLIRNFCYSCLMII